MNRSEIRTAESWRDFDHISAWVSVLLAAALLFLWLSGHGPGLPAGCCDRQAGVNEATANAAADTQIDPEVRLVFEGLRYRFSGSVRDEATRDALIEAARKAFGADKVMDELKINGNLAAAAWLAQVDELVGLLKGVGATSAVQLSGSHLTMTGTVISRSDKDAKSEAARKLVGAAGMADVLLVVMAPAPAAEMPEVDCTKIADGVDLHFADGSAALSVRGRATLDVVTGCLASGRYEIASHTDNIGGAAANLALSDSRAKNIAAYLMSKGVAEDRLEAKGYGDTRPIADNQTDRGRASNRRIAFVAR